MNLNSSAVKSILQSKGVAHVYHANTVSTSLSLLKLGSFASRQLVQESGLAQSYQYTDEIDKRFGIWNCTFFDSVDIHRRIRGVNQYGPVLFEVSVDLLDHLPNGIVRVTKSNPDKWDVVGNKEFWFETIDELNREFVVGRFDQMLVVPDSGGEVSISQFTTRIVLDDPLKQLDSISLFEMAEDRLLSARQEAGLVDVPLCRRKCGEGCKCAERYATDEALVQKYFGPF